MIPFYFLEARQHETNMRIKKTDFDLKEYNQQMAQLLINSIDYQAAHAEITRGALRVFTGKNKEKKVSLTSADVKQITGKLHDKLITKLTISNCGLDDSALIHIEELLRANLNILQVDLSGNSAITNKGLNHISAVLREIHPDDYTAGCCLRLSNPITFFERKIFNIKVVGEPVIKKNIVLSRLNLNDMEFAGRVFDQDEQHLIDQDQENQECFYTIKL